GFARFAPEPLAKLRALLGRVRKFVADTPHRQQVAGLGGILFDAAAQTFYERVNAAYGDERVTTPDLGEQRFAAEDDSGVRDQQMEQTELLIGQLDLFLIHADAAFRNVDLDPLSSNGLWVRGGSRSGARRALAWAPQQRPRAGDELADA